MCFCALFKIIDLLKPIRCHISTFYISYVWVGKGQDGRSATVLLLYYIIYKACHVWITVWTVLVAEELVTTGEVVCLGLMTEASMIQLQKYVMAKDKMKDLAQCSYFLDSHLAGIRKRKKSSVY